MGRGGLGCRSGVGVDGGAAAVSGGAAVSSVLGCRHCCVGCCGVGCVGVGGSLGDARGGGGGGGHTIGWYGFRHGRGGRTGSGLVTPSP